MLSDFSPFPLALNNLKIFIGVSLFNPYKHIATSFLTTTNITYLSSIVKKETANLWHYNFSKFLPINRCSRREYCRILKKTASNCRRKVKVISKHGTGIDNIDVAAAKAKGI